MGFINQFITFGGTTLYQFISGIATSIIYGMSSFPLTFIFLKMVKTTNQSWWEHLGLVTAFFTRDRSVDMWNLKPASSWLTSDFKVWTNIVWFEQPAVLQSFHQPHTRPQPNTSNKTILLRLHVTKLGKPSSHIRRLDLHNYVLCIFVQDVLNFSTQRHQT